MITRQDTSKVCKNCIFNGMLMILCIAAVFSFWHNMNGKLSLIQEEIQSIKDYHE